MGSPISNPSTSKVKTRKKCHMDRNCPNKIKCKVEEGVELIMTIFLNKLNKEKQDIVEFYDYTIMEEFVHQVTNVELQLHCINFYKRSLSHYFLWEDKSIK